jgi:lantibiotic modifying enzyme
MIGRKLNLVKDLQKHLEVVVDKVFLSSNEKNSEISLLVGISSRSVFLSSLLKYNPKYVEKCAQLIQKDIAYLFEYIAKNEVSPDYVDGIAGFGWVLAYLHENNHLSINEKEVFTELDEHIYQLGINTVRAGNFDLFYGAIGSGNYLIQRAKSSKEARKPLKELGKEMMEYIQAHNSLAMFTDKKEDAIDFSLSHGLSSLIVFFSNLVDLGLASTAIKDELKKCCDEILKHAKDSRVPDAFEKGKDEYSPLRWCHGELGIVSALAFASKVLADKDMNLKALKIANQVALFQLDESQHLDSATLCHGTLGVAHVFQKWYNHYWKSEQLKKATHYWQLKSNEMMSSKIGYKILNDDGVIRENHGILFGLEGIGLALITALDNDISDWESSILIY